MKLNEMKWNAVGDLLPETHVIDGYGEKFLESDPLLVYGRAQYGHNGFAYAVASCTSYDGETYEWDAYDYADVAITEVLAWMPLPEPPCKEMLNE